ncbi:MAG: hypothetical protein WC716_01100 [Chitinophagaceae bacterium]
MKKSVLILRFYGNFVVASNLITFSCWKMIDYWKMTSIIPVLFLFKLATCFLLFLWVNERKQKEYFFYYNQGISKMKLWSNSLSLDIFLFCVMLYFTILSL